MKKTVISIIFFFLTSCGLLDSDTEVEIYFPLQVGNKWYYSTDRETSLDKAEKWEIVSKKKIAKNEYYLVEKYYSSSRKDTSYYRQEGSKLIQLFIGKSKTNYYLESTFADFNLRGNDSFNYYSWTYDNEDYYSKVTLKKMDNNSITLFYNILEIVDEEHSITFEKNKGIVDFYSDGWGIHTYLIYSELK